MYAIDAAVEAVLDAEAAATEEKVEIARAALAHAAALVRGEADLEKMFAELADILEPAVPASGKWVSEVGG